MNKYKKISNRAWYGFLSIIIAMELAIFAGVIYLDSLMMKKPFSVAFKEFIPYSIVILITLFAFLFVMSRANKSNRSNKMLARMENDFKRQLKKSLKNKFGIASWFQINLDLNLMDSHESDIIKDLLSEIPPDNKESRYQLYATIGLYSLKNDDFKKAIKNFSLAIETNPKSIICHTWLAETYELIGDDINSINSYKRAEKISENIDPTLLDYFEEQINIVEKNGPRKSPPITGLKYGTF